MEVVVNTKEGTVTVYNKHGVIQVNEKKTLDGYLVAVNKNDKDGNYAGPTETIPFGTVEWTS